MAWIEVALFLGLKAFDEIFGGGSGGISDAQLKAALSDAVHEITTDTRVAILEDRLNQLRARMDSVQTTLRHYAHNPADTSLINDATWESLSICSELRLLQHPEFPALVGLPGHPLFMIAAGLRIQVLKKRIEIYGDAEKAPLKDHLNLSIEHAEVMHVAWDVFNAALFQGPFPEFQGLFPINDPNSFPTIRIQFAYKYKDSIVKTGPIIKYEPWEPIYQEAEQAAHAAMNADMDRKWQDLRSKIVQPSEEVVTVWRALRSAEFGRFPKTLSGLKLKNVNEGFRKKLQPVGRPIR